jgi:caa(3)-type oxidase subunit IV
MSDHPTSPSKHNPGTAPIPAVTADEAMVKFNRYVRLCAVIFLVVLCTTSAMIVTSYSHVGEGIGEGWTIKVALILAIAVVNAFLVAGYLMHLLSEKRLIYTVLAFTVCFFIGLMGLTLWATNGFPPGTAYH